MAQITKNELAKLQAADVLSKVEDTEAKEIEEQIKELQKGSSVTIKLTREQHIRAQREAATLGLDYKAYIKLKVNEMLEGDVGRSTIVGPSWASSGKKISAPSNGMMR